MKSLTMELRTDSYPTDNSWKIEDVCSGIILMKVSRDTEYKNRNKIYIHQKYTEYSSWKLTIKDWFGNGLCCDNGDGFFTIKYGDDVVASGGSFRSKKVINFGKGNCSSSPVSLVPSLSPIVSLGNYHYGLLFKWFYMYETVIRDIRIISNLSFAILHSCGISTFIFR